MKELLTLTLMSLVLSSCGSIVDQLHADLDRKTGQARTHRGEPSQTFDLYRDKAQTARQRYLSSKNIDKVMPPVKRQYHKKSKRQRYTPEDLNDNSNDASLWGGRKKVAYLFNLKKKREVGDIILINVLDKLKDEIALELARAFPRPIKKKKPDEQKQDQGGEGDNADQNGRNTASRDEKGTHIHDKISSVVIEEINEDHLLLKGRKNVLFRGQKRQVELETLVSRTSISDDNAVNSDNIIESSITVAR